MVQLGGGGEENTPFIILALESNSLGELGNRGIVLDSQALISGGTLYNNKPVEENTLTLFHNFRNYMKFVSNTATPRTYRLDFFNMAGELFHTDYRDTQLEQVIVDQVTGDNKYIMHF
ncbi:hypothetical protein [Ehrlichia canis]|uniref:hypothetical protein n=1 Tax=Ehrlichia canis TaxID=944 RepID=UPI00003A831E|nr:hypothetical protein [Ehrlichia canis]